MDVERASLLELPRWTATAFPSAMTGSRLHRQDGERPARPGCPAGQFDHRAERKRAAGYDVRCCAALCARGDRPKERRPVVPQPQILIARERLHDRLAENARWK